MARIVVVSYRLGGSDGVAIEAAKWIDALRMLGHRVTSVAGEGTPDIVVVGLAITDTEGPSEAALASALDGADLVIVENVASLPLNERARDVLYHVLEGRRALFHHHDLSWQRSATARLAGPRDQPAWRHVTINNLSRRELAERGIESTTIMNCFECDPPPGNRHATRRDLDVDEEPLLLVATRALERKNIAGALELCRSLGAIMWLLGPAEDDYGPQLDVLVRTSGVEVRRGLAAHTIHDAYAASDLVVMASTWEGFGNPVLESVTHRRPLALYPYPVAQEIRGYGFDFFDLHDVTSIASFLGAPNEDLFEKNLAVARAHFNLATLPERLDELLISMGIAPSY